MGNVLLGGNPAVGHLCIGLNQRVVVISLHKELAFRLPQVRRVLMQLVIVRSGAFLSSATSSSSSVVPQTAPLSPARPR